MNRETFGTNIEPPWCALTLLHWEGITQTRTKICKLVIKGIFLKFWNKKKILPHQLLHQRNFGNNIEPAWCALTFLHEEGIPKTWPKSCKLNIRCNFLRFWNRKNLFYFASSVVEPRNFRDQHWTSLMCSNFLSLGRYIKNVTNSCKLNIRCFFLRFWNRKKLYLCCLISCWTEKLSGKTLNQLDKL